MKTYQVHAKIAFKQNGLNDANQLQHLFKTVKSTDQILGVSTVKNAYVETLECYNLVYFPIQLKIETLDQEKAFLLAEKIISEMNDIEYDQCEILNIKKLY